MSKLPTDDRRSYPRLVTRFDLQGVPDDGGNVARMVARNLSLGGLYCTSTVDFPEMTRLSVRLTLPASPNPGGDGEPLEIEAVVVRREPETGPTGNARYRLALFFTRLEASTRERLASYLESLGRS